MSVRSAFAASSRGGWRAAGVADAGVLAPGKQATFAVWETPGGIAEGLPALLPDAEGVVPARPVCARTVRGRRNDLRTVTHPAGNGAGRAES
jgi:predicted amidohydrolase YtcJ